MIGWIDFSKEDRDNVGKVLSLLKDSGTVDHLGIGVLRDAFSDILFPGISTIQTRAKYFIFIPQLLVNDRKEQKSIVKKHAYDEFLRHSENELIKLTRRNNSGEMGIIGSGIAEDAELVRKPSSVYWNGLRTHKLVDTPMSSTKFLKVYSNTFEEYQTKLLEKDEPTSLRTSLPIDVPRTPEDDEHYYKIQLNTREAEYLRKKFIDDNELKQPYNLLKLFLKHPDCFDAVSDKNNVFSYDDVYNILMENHTTIMDEKLITIMTLAYQFNNYVIKGSHILYNVALQNRDNKTGFEEEWQDWKNQIETVLDDVEEFQNTFKSYFIGKKGKVFVDEWLNAILSGESKKQLIEIVTNQEIRNKRKRAKLRHGHIEEVSNKWIGIQSLNYRFIRARIIIEDIYNGLNSNTLTHA